MTYQEKLTDPRWQKKRLEIMHRDSFTCQLCGDTETTLNVHHKKYLANTEPWDYPNDNFQTLCKHCHQCAEQAKKYGDELIITGKKVVSGFVYINAVMEKNHTTWISIYQIDLTRGTIEHAIDLSEHSVELIVDLLKRFSY